ncbi:MAG: HAD family hydrolase [Acidimicrobiales bacterium]
MDDMQAGTAPIGPIKGALFDLDDTLFEQAQWLSRAWVAVGEAAGAYGADPEEMTNALMALCAEGSDSGHIIDRALQKIGAFRCPVGPLLAAFRHFSAPHLEPYPRTAELLFRLRAKVPIGLVTDGDPAVQRAKLESLGLSSAFDVCIFSDELGRAHRKPDPLPFRAALRELGLAPSSVVVVGDRPSKDIAGAVAAGMRAVRVLSGEYRAMPDHPRTWATVPDVAAAIALIEDFADKRRGQVTKLCAPL